jgi:hypothetical protein
MKPPRPGRHLLAAALLLTLTGCFTVIVKHAAVVGGRIEKGPADVYIDSPDSVIEVRRETNGVSPRISVKVSADSSEGLKVLSYEVLKGDGKTGRYRTVASESRSATETVDSSGQKKWSTHLELPAVLDLSGTGSVPLLLRVTAEQRDGTMKIVAAKYRELPAE